MADQYPTPTNRRPAPGRDPAPGEAVRVYDRPARPALPPAVLAVLALFILMLAIAFLAFRFVF